ncbi:hypothetical protein CJ030_MR4G023701 [Morella rubra]|uniref:Uncharacterized protein n=1 Tax=Morella rubra TaxID=262757 RepID=A0A6A1VVE8_9ROSI|nr:hypothetical protein CJ030_MR4G023701 [Morella rubra]
MAHRTIMMTLLLVILLVQQNFGSIAESRPVNIQPPAIPRGSLTEPNSPSTIWFTINRYKNIEDDAFRPTSPGHSPGVGHPIPPNAP